MFQKVQEIYTRLLSHMFIIDQSRNTLQLNFCAELRPTFWANHCPFTITACS